MPKEQLVHPRDVRKKDTLTIAPIPVNHYQSDPEAEKKRYGIQRLQRVYHDMMVIREFETMLNTIKMTGEWEGIAYNHAGPAHLSIGQESAAVGQAIHLDAQDFIFGSHRSHGEILAKCFSAIDQSDETTLQSVMETYLGGDILRVLEKQGTAGSARDLAEDFILYGTLAEIFARNTGLNRGLGGSMHAFFAPFGSMPNNAIVGGSADIALGSALYKRINGKPGIVIANIGDASAACGPVWEAIMIAAMDQYRTLWPGEAGGAPPVIFNFFNNFYGMGGQTVGETMGFKILARLGAGVNEDNMHAERVDGSNPLAVADAILRKKEVLAQGRGPVLLDTITYRISGHSPSDASSYRSKEEIDLWKDHDPIGEFRSYLLENGMADESTLQDVDQQVREKLIKATRLAVDLEASPRMNPEAIAGYMFSNGRAEALDQGEPRVLLPLEENPRVKQLEKKERFAIGPDGTPVSKMKTYQLRDALFEAMIHRFYKDPTMVAYGEENRDWGGAFAVYRGLTEALPYQRLFNSSIAEGAIVGSGVGYALSGGRAVVELMYNDFMGRAGDEIFNQMAKWQAMSAGVLTMPLVVRVSVGSKYGAQHSQDWCSIISHIPGLKVYFPATPYDAKGMLNQALAGTDPVIFFESQRLYDIGELFHTDGVPREYYEITPGEPDIKKAGTDLTIVTIGATLYRALEAARELEERYGISAEVIDARFINPLNLEPIVESVRKTGRLVLASDAVERGSFLYSLGGTVAQLAFDYLDAPPVVVGSRNWITPASELEDSFFPQKEWIIDAIHEKILPLPGHRVSTVQTNGELLRRYREGV
ncbi:dehydrogenase [Alkalispirochaeta sphaeroplastigenens]|uniref:Dehydrogenase n=1 Tax=Alkalispirochaeta sphaeroplastigenens TaxID=1187066 RepID=A0A2S4K1Q7_9SPIO|nr:alpha-ketoacid dehydrogenase subunit alpha/beta [Alkalispirochaeta sphaeroplastigenens]POR05698.1 dehydrogenase [Alkalispirochaeta sphaeroplastigenens]